MTSNGKLIDWGKLYRAERCPRCYGKGRTVARASYSETSMNNCPECGGDGVQLIPAGEVVTLAQFEAVAGFPFPKS